MAPVPPDVAEVIRRKKQQYGRFVDTKQWEELGKLVVLPDAKLSFFQPDGSPLTVGNKALVFNSYKAYADFIGRRTAGQRTIHSIAHGELEQTGPDEVKAIFAMQDMAQMKGATGLIQVNGGGHYHEVWKRVGNDWFMSSLRLERSVEVGTLGFVLAMMLVNFMARLGVDLAP